MATAAATMLLCDAWFDVLSSDPGRERLTASCSPRSRHVEEVAERAQRHALVARRLRPRRRAAVATAEAPAETG